jgi:GH15 family glucan-1,4-alpha-glucosidase
VTARADRIAALIDDRHSGRPIAIDRFLSCRFTLDGADDDSEWWNFQLDGYGAWLWALAAHAARTGRDAGPFAEGVRLSVDYLTEFWNDPCYDWWEEHAERRHTSTLAAIAGGLAAIAQTDGIDSETASSAQTTAALVAETTLQAALVDGALTKWLGGDAVDASLVACATPFRLLEPRSPVAAATLAQIEARLVDGGGVHRYETDTYFGGGQWILLAGLLGWHYTEVGRIDDAWSQLRWMAAQARTGGELPEQTPAHQIAPEREREWIERWGPSACPLLWSHAMYVTLAVELGLPAGPAA